MIHRFMLVAVWMCAVVLSGCATPPVVVPMAASQLWQDDVFHYRADRVQETRQELFELDAAALASLKAFDKRSESIDRRLENLLTQLYSQHGIRLSYKKGHTTGAAQTWRDKQGDCLSLTIMVYAATQALGITSRMQEVQVPLAVDRHGGFDFINGHVNVFVNAPSVVTVNGRDFGSGGIVIDFELQPGSRRMGRELSEDQIVSRFFNNRATEFLVNKDLDNAYAYYKAAIQADPRYASVYANLAQLYSRVGKSDAAEQLLHHALALQADSYATLRAMQDLMRAQGRVDEAQLYANRLHLLQHDDPYYWLGLGLDALQNARYAEAVRTLERAEKLSTGFQEIHFNLALAYMRNGQREQAVRQISLLDRLLHDEPSLMFLNKKLQSLSAQSSFL